MTSEGRIWKFGDDVNTDLIIPGRYLSSYDVDVLSRYAMEGLDPEFAEKVSPGDMVVAGRNFGCGSSREQAVGVLKASGIRAVVARSFSRIFYRNSINLGLHVIESEDAHGMFDDGDLAVLDLERNTLTSADGTRKAILKEVPPHLKTILSSGGLIPHLRSSKDRDTGS